MHCDRTKTSFSYDMERNNRRKGHSDLEEIHRIAERSCMRFGSHLVGTLSRVGPKWSLSSRMLHQSIRKANRGEYLQAWSLGKFACCIPILAMHERSLTSPRLRPEEDLDSSSANKIAEETAKPSKAQI